MKPLHRHTDADYIRILEALEPFKLSDGDTEKAARGICHGSKSKLFHHNLTLSNQYLDFYGKVETVVKKFADAGLTFDAYVKSAIRQPQLFYSSPDTLARNINGLVEKFSGEGLTLERYLIAALKYPTLFTLLPERVEWNIREVVKEFANDGMTLEAYLDAALRYPPLFGCPSNNIADHIRYFFRLADEGILRDGTSHAAVLNKLLTNYPSLLGVAKENIETRHALCQMTDRTFSLSSISLTPKRKITRDLVAHVAVLDHALPRTGYIVGEPERVIDASSVQRGEQLLVNLAARGALDPAVGGLVHDNIQRHYGR